jgi:putative inorganic carbon (HCO3(-)) transporter
VNASIAAPATRHQYGIALVTAPVRLMHGLVSVPVLVFLATLTAMLFRPPDLKSFPLDRVAFVVLVACVGFRLCFRREQLRSYPATWPMLALMLLGLWGVTAQPYDPQAWSLLAAKWIVPFVLFHFAGIVFRDQISLRKLETFALAVFVYLTAVSVFHLVDAKSLILPRFILDEGIGIHTDRARGPFLQAVANGVCLTLLGLIALDSFRRRRLRGLLAGVLFVAAPLALLATKTRAVWVAAAISIGFLAFFGSGRRVRRAALSLCALVALGLCVALLYRINSASLAERLEDRSPVDFRVVMYETGWQMFTEKPLTGWNGGQNLQAEISRRVWDFHPAYYVFHNTYLELAVERGLVGLSLYAWLMACLFRLARTRLSATESEPHFLDSHFRKLWPLMLGVYLLNASAVVMSYQFVNGFLFTIAGILSAQNAAQRRRLPEPRV